MKHARLSLAGVQDKLPVFVQAILISINRPFDYGLKPLIKLAFRSSRIADKKK